MFINNPDHLEPFSDKQHNAILHNLFATSLLQTRCRTEGGLSGKCQFGRAGWSLHNAFCRTRHCFLKIKVRVMRLERGKILCAQEQYGAYLGKGIASLG